MSRDDDPERPELDEWFRAQGLPTMVPIRRWGDDLPRRITPIAVYLTVLSIVLSAALYAYDQVPELDDLVALALIVVLLAISFVIAQLAFWLVRGLLHRLSSGLGTLMALVLIIVCTGFVALSSNLLDPAERWWDAAGVGIVVMLIFLLLAASGGGALLAWTARLAFRNLTAIAHMASIALPVILMLVIFAFFSAELWQLTTNLSWGRLAQVGVVIIVLALVVVLRVCQSEIDQVRAELTPELRARLIAQTPAAELDGAPTATSVPLSPLQRANMLLVMSVAQLILAGLFAALQAALLVVLGSIALTPDTIAIWLGPGTESHPMAIQPIVVSTTGQDVVLPISVNLIKASVFLGMVSSLTFVFSAVSEPRYRERFFDPIMADLRRALAVHDLVGADARERLRVRRRLRRERRRQRAAARSRD